MIILLNEAPFEPYSLSLYAWIGGWLALTMIGTVWESFLRYIPGWVPMLHFAFYQCVALYGPWVVFNVWADHEPFSKGTAFAAGIAVFLLIRFGVSLLYRKVPFAELHQLRARRAGKAVGDLEGKGLFEGFAQKQGKRKWRRSGKLVGMMHTGRWKENSERIRFSYLFDKRAGLHASCLIVITAALALGSLHPAIDWSRDELLPGGIGIGTYAGRQLDGEGEEAYGWEARDVRVGIDASRRQMRMLLWGVRDGENYEVQVRVNGETVRTVWLSDTPEAVRVPVPAVVEIVGMYEPQAEREAQKAQTSGPAQETNDTAAGEPDTGFFHTAKTKKTKSPDETVSYGVKFAGALRNEAYFNSTSAAVPNMYTIGLE